MEGASEVGVEATFADGKDSGVGAEGAEEPQIGWCDGKDIPGVDANGVGISGKQYGGATGELGASRGCWGCRGVNGLGVSGWGVGLVDINGVDIDYGVAFEPMGMGVYHGWMVSTMA